MKLYDYQTKILEAIADGKQLIKASCSAGKTLTSLMWAKSTGKRKVLVITQASVRDSCFVSGTMVSTPNGEVSIEDMKVGDEVYAYNGNKVVIKKVKRLIKKIDNKPLYRMTYAGSRDIIGTGDHPIYNGDGYTPLKDIKKGNYLYGITCPTSRSQQKTSGSLTKILPNKPSSSMCKLWQGYPSAKHRPKMSLSQTRHNVLQSRVFNTSEVYPITQGECKEISSKVSQRMPLRLVWQRDYRPNYVPASHLSQDQKNILFGGMREEKESNCSESVSQEFDQVRMARLTGQTSKDQTGQVDRATRVAETHTSYLRVRDGVCSEVRGLYSNTRPSRPTTKDWDRDRRATPQVCQPQATRPATRREVKKVRVEDIQVLRRGRLQDGSYANQVYCIEVEDCHNFFANGILVHNCGFEREIEKFGELFSEWYHSLSSFSVVSWSGLAKWLDSNWASLDEWAVIADEVASCKGAGKINGKMTAQGKAFIQLAKRSDCWTGWTATPGDTWDDYCAYFIATGKVRNKTYFQNKFCAIQRHPFPRLLAKLNQDLYMQYKNEIWHEVDSSEMEAELPETIEQTVKFKQPTGYKQLMKTHELNGEFLDNASALAHAARRLCGSKQKLDWLADFVGSADAPCIVFYSYESEREAIEHAVQSKVGKIWHINGKEHDVPTEDTIGKHDVVLAQWQAGAFGLNLQFMNYWISFSPNYSYTVTEQAKKRIHRKGQTKVCKYWNLVCENTIDEAVYKVLNSKRDFDELLWGEEKIK